MKRLQLQQHQMLYVLDLWTTKETPQIQQSQPTPVAGVSETPVRPSTSNLDTPRMTIAQYENSPYISRKRRIQFQFLDFEVDITPEEFAKIPQ